MLAAVIEYLVAASLLISAAQVYLIVSKVWSRKHDPVVASAQSTASNLLGLVTGLPWVIKYAQDGEAKLAAVSALWLGLTLFFTLVGIGLWVPGRRQGLGSRLREALRLEQQEVGELLKSVVRPSDASLVLTILRQLSLIDQKLDPHERRFIELFARAWGLPSPLDETAAAAPAGHEALRASVVEYLERRPPPEQARQLREIMAALLHADHEVSPQEALVESELGRMLDAYLAHDGSGGQHRVVVVPQSETQDEAIRALLPGAARVPFRGGSAYVAGSFYSADFGRVMLDKYRALGFFSVLDSAPPSSP